MIQPFNTRNKQLRSTQTCPNNWGISPVGGTIDIYKEGEMSDWKFSDSGQKIWKIHLKSNVISVWDSIYVGLSREKAEEFGQVNNAFCMKKGDFFYSCEFDDFLVIYNFKADTIRDLKVIRICEGETIDYPND